MKNKGLKALMLMSIVLLSSFTVADSFVGVKKIIGEWDYTVPDASYEYQSGVLILSKVDKELTGKLNIGGYDIPLDDVDYKKNNLKASINVQGETVTLDLNFTKSTFEGTASYSMGDLTMKGVKKD